MTSLEIYDFRSGAYFDTIYLALIDKDGQIVRNDNSTELKGVVSSISEYKDLVNSKLECYGTNYISTHGIYKVDSQCIA